MIILNSINQNLVILSVFLLLIQCNKSMKGGKQCCPGKNDCRTYTFAFTQVKPRSMIVDGKLVGSRVELIKHICQLAGKKCEAVPVLFDDCLRREKLPVSDGLNNHWFDVCVDIQNTPFETLLYRAPKHPFFKIPPIQGLVVKQSQLTAESFKQKGHNLSLAFPRYEDFTLGIVLKKYREAGFFVRDELVTKVKTGELNEQSATVIELVKNRTVDLGLMIPLLADAAGTKYILKLFDFDLGSVGMLARKDEDCIFSWFDHFHLQFICSAKYNKFCKKMLKKYGPPLSVHCVSEANQEEWCNNLK